MKKGGAVIKQKRKRGTVIKGAKVMRENEEHMNKESRDQVREYLEIKRQASESVVSPRNEKWEKTRNSN